MNRVTYIYTLADPLTGLVRYVGKANNPQERFRDGHLKKLTKNGYKGNWIKNLLANNSVPTLEIIDEVPEEEWKFWECHYISLFRSWGMPLTNLNPGGNGGRLFIKFSHSEESKRKMSEARKGIRFSEEHKKKLSDAKKGKHPVFTWKNKKQPRELIEKRVATRAGYKHSEETKRKIGEANRIALRGKKQAPEVIQKRLNSLAQYRRLKTVINDD